MKSGPDSLASYRFGDGALRGDFFAAGTGSARCPSFGGSARSGGSETTGLVCAFFGRAGGCSPQPGFRVIAVNSSMVVEGRTLAPEKRPTLLSSDHPIAGVVPCGRAFHFIS